MMRPHLNTVLLIVLLLSGLVFPFTASNYFYGSETDVTVTSDDFTMDGTDYSIIYFDGDPIFLVKDGEIVENDTVISEKIYDYYITNYYPSDEDIDEMLSLIEAYNVSRNDGYDWRDKEEYICREIMFTDKRIEVYIEGEMQKLWCHDDASCDINAKLLFQAYHEYTGWNSFESALEPLEQFAYASYGTDFILENMTNDLNNMDEESIVDTILYIQESVPILREYVVDIESTIFRTPRLDDDIDRDDCYLKCYALCPSFDLDENLLDDIEDKADELYGKIGPLATFEETSASLRSNTAERLAYYENVTTAQGHDAVFAPIESKGLEVENFAKNVSSLVANTSFSMKVDRLSELRMSIRADIDTMQFDGLEEDIDEYEDLVESVNESAHGLYAIYNETMIAKQSAERVLFEVGTKDLGPVELEKYEELKLEMDELSDDFGTGLTPAAYEEMEENYSEITTDALAILGSTESHGVSKAMVYFRGFARKVNTGLADFATNTNITNVEEIPENKYVTFGGFSLLVFLCLSSILLLWFLYLVKVHNYSRIKYVVASAFILGILVVGLFSVFLFVFMQKTSMDATMDEFLVDFDDRETIALIIDQSTATSSETSAMMSCASDITTSIEENNKTVTLYYLLAGGGCNKVVGSSQTALGEEACLSDINGMDSAIYLIPSGTVEEPHLYTTYFSKAEIYGTSDYYASCPLSSIFE